MEGNSRRVKNSKSKGHHHHHHPAGVVSRGPSRQDKAAGALSSTDTLAAAGSTIKSPRGCSPAASGEKGGSGRTSNHHLQQARASVVQARGLVMELGLLLLHLAQLAVQSGNLYRSHFREYDVDVLIVASACLGRHLFLRYLRDALTSRKKLQRHVTMHPRTTAAFAFYLIVLPTVCGARLLSSWRAASLLLCLLPSLLSLALFPPVLSPAPWPPDMLHFSTVTNSATSSSSSNSGTGGKALRRRLAPYVLRYLLFRLIEATYTTGLLPVLVNQHPYLFYRPWRCFLHAVLFATQTSLLLLAQTALLLREQLHAEGEPWRTWSLLPPGTVPQSWSSSSSSSSSSPSLLRPLSRWRPGEQFPAGSVVIHRGKHYVATGWQQQHHPSSSSSSSSSSVVSQPGRSPEPPELPLKRDQRVVYAAFAGDWGEARTSPLLLTLQLIQALSILGLVYLMMNSLQWVPYGVMLLGGLETLALINIAQRSSDLGSQQQQR